MFNDAQEFIELLLLQLRNSLLLSSFSLPLSPSVSLMSCMSFLLLSVFPPEAPVCRKWHADFHVKAFLFAGLSALSGILSVAHVCMASVPVLSATLFFPSVCLSSSRCLLQSSWSALSFGLVTGVRDAW